MNYKVIDNFLDKTYFDNLASIFTEQQTQQDTAVPWYYQPNVAFSKGHENRETEKADTSFYMTSLLYVENMPTSPHYEKLIPFLNRLGAKCLIRIKANLYPNTEILYEHPMHIDVPFISSAAILSMNTCDGYTKLKDGTKIDSIANRLLLFDASKEHCSTTTTTTPARINININYIQEHYIKNYIQEHYTNK